MKQGVEDKIGGQAISALKNLFDKSSAAVIKMLLLTVVGATLSFSQIADKISPFGTSFVAAVHGRASVFAALGSVLGYVIRGEGYTRYVAQIIILLAIKWAFAAFFEIKQKWPQPLVAAAVNLSVGSVGLFINSASVYDALLLICECALAGGAAYFLQNTLKMLSETEMKAATENVVALSVSVSLIIISLSKIVVGSVSVGGVAAVYLCLLASNCFGALVGGCSGLCIGIALSIGSLDGGFFVMALGFGGLISGLFTGLSRYGVILSFLVCNVLAIAISGAEMRELYFLYESVAASTLFLFTPTSLFKKLARFKANDTYSDTYPNKYLASKLSFVSRTLAEASQSICELSTKINRKTAGTDRVFSAAADSVCRRCANKLKCWDSSYTDMMDSFNHLIPALKNTGRVEPQDVPDYLRQNCIKLPTLISQIDTNYYKNLRETQNAARISQLKEVMAQQFSGVSRILCEMSQELSLTMCDRESEMKIERELRYQGLSVSEISCPVDKFGRRSVEFYLPRAEADKYDIDDLAKVLCEICDTEMINAGVINTEDLTRLTFSQAAPFSIELGQYQKSADDEACGDSFCTLNLGSGFSSVILSDGMGQGKSAALDSKMTLSLVSKLLKLGFSVENAVSLVNSALMLKSEDESLSTLDIATFDLHTGKTEIKKSGAAPSFLKRGRRVSKVQMQSLPLGIVGNVEVSSLSLSLSRGDTVIMASDGLCSLRDNEIESIIRKNDGATPSELAKILGTAAEEKSREGKRDDITVLVAQIK